MCLSRPIRHQQQSSHISIIRSRSGSPEEQTVVEPNPASDLNFRIPGHCQSYLLTDLITNKRGRPPLHFQFSKEPMTVEDMASIMACASCDECGLLLETLSDLQNHARNWCYIESDRKRPRLESQCSEVEDEDNIAFINMVNEMRHKNDLKHTFRNTRQMTLI